MHRPNRRCCRSTSICRSCRDDHGRNVWIRLPGAAKIMLSAGLIAFTAPWVLAALAALPIIWWLLRVTPPAPRLVRFPAIRLLFRLREKEDTPAKTPWWLL